MGIRAIYEDGYLRLLDPVTLTPGQQVTVTIETPSESNTLRNVLGDPCAGQTQTMIGMLG